MGDAIGYLQSKANGCVVCKVVDGEVEMGMVVYVDDIPSHAKGQATME